MIAKQALTARQAECMGLAREGMTSKEISRELGISPHTVDSHIQSALGRIGGSSRRQPVIRRMAATLHSDGGNFPEAAIDIIAAAIEGLIGCLDALQPDADTEDDDADAEHDGREDDGPC